MTIDKFLATGQAPDSYTFSGDVITAHTMQASEDFDLSGLAHGDEFEGVEPATLELPGTQIIRDAHRDEQGELHVTLCQRTPENIWEESDPVDPANYDPNTRYIKNVG